MSSNKDDGRMSARRRQPSSEFYARDFTKLDIEHQAAELGMLRVREKGFRRTISNWLKSGGTQKAAE